MHSVLICDDDELLHEAIGDHLQAEGYAVLAVEDGGAALQAIDEALPDVVVLDLHMPRVDGFTVLKRVRELHANLPVIVMTGHGGISSAIEATKLGASAYLCKPFDPNELSLHVQRALHPQRPDDDLHTANAGAVSYDGLVGDSAAMRAVFDTLRRIEPVDAPTVLITGESGTGKDLVARAIHARGPRREKPYVEIDCVAMPDTLIESELFGHEKGSFTDARQTKRGLFEIAKGGVIFLDEIGEMAPATQAKLLRALENRKFKRVGGVTEMPLDAAVIAATNRNLRDEVKAGRFREDLFFRLNVVPIELPPLRRRGRDIESLALHLVQKMSDTMGRKVSGISSDAMDVLRRYPWPGNVRELRNAIERAVILKQQDAAIQIADLPPEIRSRTHDEVEHVFRLPDEGVDLQSVEKSLVQQALERSAGNRTHAAKLLGISRFALRYRLEKFGLL